MGRDAERVIDANGWAVRLDASRLDVAERLRCHTGVELLIVDKPGGDAEVWLRGQRADVALIAVLDGLPGGERFDVDADGHCRAPGRYLAEAHLPEGVWQAIREAIPVELPTPQLPASLSGQLSLRIVRGGAAGTGTLLCTELSVFAKWVASAAAVRFEPLRMAVDARGRALVIGHPLPPLPGEVAVVTSGVAIAAGYRLEPDVAPDLAAKVLMLTAGDLAWFAADGSCTCIRAEQFVAVRRSAVRTTLEECERDG